MDSKTKPTQEQIDAYFAYLKARFEYELSKEE